MKHHVRVLDEEFRNPGSYFGRHGTRDTTAMIRDYLATVTVSFCVNEGIIYRLLRRLDGSHVIHGGGQFIPIAALDQWQIELLSVSQSVMLPWLPYDAGITIIYAHFQPESCYKYWSVITTDRDKMRHSSETSISLSEGWKNNKRMYPDQRCYTIGKKTINFPPNCLAIRFDAAGRMLRLETDGKII